MTIYALIGTLVVLAVAIKLFEQRIPRAVYQAGTVIYVLVPFLALIDAIWMGWGRWIGGAEFMLFVVFALLTGIGTGVGYHRLLTHRSFETTPPIRALFIVLGAMALPTRPVDFAANHLKHHAFSDHDGDPHSPLDGLFHAHLGWILRAPKAERERYGRHLLNDRLVMALDRTALLWFVLGLVIPYLVAGWQGLLWGGLIRYGYHNHVTFAVNSICHTFGRQPFATGDESRNQWLIGVLAFGEGWHNNHHAFPAMAYHGMERREFDLNGLVIRGLAKTGLAWNVKQPSPDLIARRRKTVEPETSAAPAATSTS